MNILKRQTLCMGALHVIGYSSNVLANTPAANLLRMIVPFPAGGPTDTLARQLQSDLARELQQTVIIENVPGANGALGSARLARSPSDGNTLLIGSASNLVAAIGKSTEIRVEANPFRLLDVLATAALVLVTRYASPIHDVDDALRFIKSKAASRVSYASYGQGSIYHLAGMELSKAAEREMIHVPYKGFSQVIPDLMSGEIDFAFLPFSQTAQQFIAERKIRALGITRKKRMSQFADVQALAAKPGLASLEMEVWIGLMSHKDTAIDRIRALKRAIRQALNQPETLRLIESTGNSVPPVMSESELAVFQQQEVSSQSRLALLSN